MQSNGVEPRGHVLLIGGADVVHRRRLRWSPTAGLAALARVPAAVLVGDEGHIPDEEHLPVDTVAIQAARDANEVLSRLRAAAAASGPLLVYLAGRLVLDRKRRELHLALAGTTVETVRYTALPWTWLCDELRDRTLRTTVVVELLADAHAWRLLQHQPDAVSAGLPLYGVVAAPDAAAEPLRYTKSLAELMRSSQPPAQFAQLHASAVAAAQLAPGTLILPSAPALPAPALSAQVSQPNSAPVRPPDPRPFIWQAAQAGRHNEAASMAAAWEQHAWRTYGPTSVQANEWLEIRADLARIAGNLVSAAELWIAAAKARLSHHAPDARQVTAAVQSAHWCWNQIGDPAKALEIGPHLITLLEQLPSLDPRQLPAARKRWESLAAGGWRSTTVMDGRD
ncbi:MAG: hypothetical protein JO362_06165 [Streptomycetaceae bacterium]|nr:hypothetical protein [Streptomycetaceae bacterium]